MNIYLRGQSVAITNNHKLMGVLIDYKLNFDKHISNKFSKESQSLGKLRRTLHLAPMNVLRNLFYTLIYSRLSYTITAWVLSFNSTTRRIESLI